MKFFTHGEIDKMLEEAGLDILKVPYYRPKLSLFLSEIESKIVKEYERDPNEILEENYNERKLLS